MKKIPICLTSTATSRPMASRAYVVDRPQTASRLGLSPAIETALYNAFGQAPGLDHVHPLNQYHVVMEVPPEFKQIRNR